MREIGQGSSRNPVDYIQDWLQESHTLSIQPHTGLAFL